MELVHVKDFLFGVLLNSWELKSFGVSGPEGEDLIDRIGVHLRVKNRTVSQAAWVV